MESKPPTLNAEIRTQMTRLTERALAASARARVSTTRHDDIAQMIRLANTASDLMLATTRLCRAVTPRRVARKTFFAKF
jgi:hypothetical protein